MKPTRDKTRTENAKRKTKNRRALRNLKNRNRKAA